MSSLFALAQDSACCIIQASVCYLETAAASVFRPVYEARLKYHQQQQLERNPKGPAPVLLEPRCRLYVEGTAGRPEDHAFVQALRNSGRINKDIDVKEISTIDKGKKKVLGWCAFTYQVDQASCAILLILPCSAPFQVGMESSTGIFIAAAVVSMRLPRPASLFAASISGCLLSCSLLLRRPRICQLCRNWGRCSDPAYLTATPAASSPKTHASQERM